MPRWLLARPYLHAGALGWINLHRRNRALLPGILVASLVAAALFTLPAVGAVLEFCGQNPVIPFVLVGAATMVLTARRKARIYQELSTSWLAPLAAPASILERMLLSAFLQLALMNTAWGISCLAGNSSPVGVKYLGIAVNAAWLAGTLAGWFAPHDKTVGAPDFHYVPVRKPRPNWNTAPRLGPLSYWTLGQARVSAKPKTTAKALIFVLLALPLNIGGEKVIAIAGGTLVAWYLLALAVSAARVAVAAARWLAATTVRYVPFTWAVGHGILAAQLWTCAWVVIFTLMLSVPMAWRVGKSALECVVLTCMDIALACWLGMRAVGMRPGFRRADK
jgi:hypothetical protein